MSEEKVLTLEDAIKCIQTAVALGAEVPAPIGTFFFEASIHWEKNLDGSPMNSITFGYYKNEADALTELYNMVLDSYSDEFAGPWVPPLANLEDETNVYLNWEEYVELREEYLKSHTKEELINSYYKIRIHKSEILPIHIPLPGQPASMANFKLDDGGFRILKVKVH